MIALGFHYALSAMLLYSALCLALASGLRSSLRLLQGFFERRGIDRERVGIFGAGAEGEMIASLLQKNTFLNATPVLFLDYDRSKEGMCIRGIPVRCCGGNLGDLAGQFRLQSILIAGPFDENLHANLRRECSRAGVRTKMLDITIRDLDASRSLIATAG